jgi:hypothetical protein
MDCRLRISDCRLARKNADFMGSGDRTAQMVCEQTGKAKVHRGAPEAQRGEELDLVLTLSRCPIRVIRIIRGLLPFLLSSPCRRVSVVNSFLPPSNSNLPSSIRNLRTEGSWHS